MKWIQVYDRNTGRKLGLRPESWLKRFDHIEETPVAKSRRSPKKKAVPEEAADTAPEEENN